MSLARTAQMPLTRRSRATAQDPGSSGIFLSTGASGTGLIGDISNTLVTMLALF